MGLSCLPGAGQPSTRLESAADRNPVVFLSPVGDGQGPASCDRSTVRLKSPTIGASKLEAEIPRRICQTI